MTAPSLNHVFRLVWSDRLGCFVPVTEHAKSCGRAGSLARRHARAARAAIALSALTAGATAMAAGLPTGAQITAGSAALSQAGNTLTIAQSSAKLITNWQSFSIAAGSTVRFIQPSATSVALNRVVGSDVSSIQGSLQANGQVFLLNPNGVLFTPTARVDTGGLLASTLGMSDGDFLAGNYRLQGTSLAEVRNQGRVNADGGAVALIAAKVVNEGEISTRAGQVLMAAGSDVTLDVGAAVKLRIGKGVLDALVDNGGAIRADGGTVLLTARSLDQIHASMVRNSGEIRAQTLATGVKGEILLLGDMSNGALEAGGRLDASAPLAGDGGHIETSAAHVSNAPALTIDAGSRNGQGGTWLIDPYDYTINASAASNIAAALNTGTSVTVSTQANVAGQGSGGSASGSGDITVSSAITKSAGGNATLTLQADRNITVSSAITSTVGQLGIKLSAANNASSANGGVNVNANLASNGGRILIGGAGGNVTATQAYGIGFALNPTSSTAAVTIGGNVSIASSGGDITINGRTSATTNSYEGTKAGIYVLSGATVNTGGGNLYMSAVSTGSAKEFAFNVEANSNTVTTFRTSSTTGGIFVDVNNTLDPLGSLGLVNNGGQAKVQFWAPSVAHMLFRLNGSNQAATFTQSPPCNPGYPNCGTMVIPGGNQSYTSAGYNVVSMAMNPIYVFTGNGSKTYDGTTDASNVALSFLGGPNGFSLANLGALSFATSAKDVGSYTSLTQGAGNPTSYSSGSYAVAYFNQGTYTVSQKQLSNFQATNKTYDGTTAAAVSATGLIGGDNVTINATGAFNSANAGNGIGVSITGISLSGADAGNYSLPAFSAINTTADITKAPLTVTAGNASKTYDGSAYSGGNGASYSGFVNGETSTVLGGSLSYAGTAQGAINAGSYTLTPSGLTSGNYQISYANGALTVNPATLTYFASPASRSYGSANPAFSGSVSGFVGSDTLLNATTGTLSFTSPATTSSSVGSYTINGSGLSANNGNYVFAQAAGNTSALSITPAALTVTAGNASKTYNGLAYTGGNGVSYSGLVNGETSSVLGGTLSYAGNSQGAVNAGSYTLTPQGLTASNYAISYASGTLTVNPAALTITAGNATKTYDGQAYSGGGGVSYAGFVNGQTSAVLGGSLSYSGASQGAVNAGSYAITPQGLTSSNYAISFASGTLTVNPATLTITAGNFSKTYDGIAYSGGNGVSYSGLVNGETSAVLGGTLSYGGTSQGATNAGNYTITPQGLTSSNYAISYANGTLTIAPAGLTLVTAGLTGTVTKTYDGTNTATLSSGNYLLSGFVNGDGATVTKTVGTYTDANAGTAKTVTVSLSPSDFSASGSTNLSNYSLPTTVSGAVGSITPAPLTVTAANASKTYNGQAYSGGSGVSYSGFVNGETAAVLGGVLSYGGTSQGAVNAGSYGIAPSGLTSSNYAITFTNGALTVNPASLTVTAANASKTYDGVAYSGGNGVSYSGFVNGETAAVLGGTLSYAGTSQGAVNAGSYAITPTGLSSSNYAISYTNGALTISPASLTVITAGLTGTIGKTYDGTNIASLSSGNYLLSGFVNGDGATVTKTIGAYADANVGTGKTVTVTLSPGDFSATGSTNLTNYVLPSSASGAIGSISPAALTITANSASKTYNAVAYSGANGVSYNGFVNGETAAVLGGSLSFTGSSQGAINAGSYTITPQGLAAGNYAITFGNGTLTVNRAPLVITASTATKTYDGSTTSTAAPTVAGLQGTDTVSGLTQAYTDKNAGTNKSVSVTGYQVNDGNGGGNYYVSTAGSTSGVIERANASVSATATAVTYNGTTQSQLAPVASGFLAGDAITVAGAASGRNAGSYDSALSVGGADAGNYNVTLRNAALTISRASLSLLASANTKTYDGTTSATATPTAIGLQAGDTVTSLTEAYADRNAGSGKALDVTGYSLNDGHGGANYDVRLISSNAGSISPATLTLSVAPASRNAGSANPAFTASVTGFVGSDTLATATTGTLTFSTAADPASLPGQYAVTASGLTANHGNYVFTQAPGNLDALGITEAPLAPQQFLPKTVPVPNFPDNAMPVLGSQPGRVSTSSLNYVPVAAAPAPAATSPIAASPSPSPSPLPLPQGQGLTGTAGTASGDVGAGGGALSAQGFVITEQALTQLAGGTATPTATADGSPVAGVSSSSSKTARIGTAGVTVSSANGPLDVYVIDGGVNVQDARKKADR